MRVTLFTKLLLTILNSPILPFSDLDLTICYQGDDAESKDVKRERLRYVSAAMRSLNGAHSFKEIFSANHPILKLMIGRIELDISVNSTEVAAVASWIIEQKQQHPFLKDLSMLVKSIFERQKLMETFSGGLSSFHIVCLLIAFGEVSVISPFILFQVRPAHNSY